MLHEIAQYHTLMTSAVEENPGASVRASIYLSHVSYLREMLSEARKMNNIQSEKIREFVEWDERLRSHVRKAEREARA